MVLSDESLLAGLASGHPEDASAFVRRFRGRVYGVALAIVGDPAAADEVAQEAFIRAWRHAGSFDPRRGRVSSWLLAITRNVALDARRPQQSLPLDPDVLLALPIPNPDDGPEERALEEDEAHRVRRAIETLPDDQRRALLLATFLGWTAREISESEGIPLGTAKTRIRAAVMKLRLALDVEYKR